MDDPNADDYFHCANCGKLLAEEEGVTLPCGNFCDVCTVEHCKGCDKCRGLEELNVYD